MRYTAKREISLKELGVEFAELLPKRIPVTLRLMTLRVRVSFPVRVYS